MLILFFLFGVVIMALQIAETRFITRHKDGVAAVDVYGDSPKSEPINAGSTKSGLGSDLKIPNLGKFNSSADNLKKVGASIEKALKDTRGKSFSEISKAVSTAVGGKKGLINSIALGSITDALTNVGFSKNAKEIAGELLGARDPNNLLGLIGASDPQMKILVDGIGVVRSAKDLDTAQGISNMLGALTGNTELVKVLALQPQALVLKTLLDDATSLRIPSLVDTILGTIEEESQKKQLLYSLAPKAAENSDLYTIELIMDSLGGYNLNRTYPDLTNSIVTNWTTLSGLSPTEEDITSLLTTLNKLNPDWYYTKRNGKKVYNLDLFSVVSPHAEHAFKTNPELLVPLALSGKYTPQEVRTLFKKQRPWIEV